MLRVHTYISRSNLELEDFYLINMSLLGNLYESLMFLKILRAKLLILLVLDYLLKGICGAKSLER